MIIGEGGTTNERISTKNYTKDVEADDSLAQNNEANPSVALKNDNDHAIGLDVNIPPISKG